MVASAELQPPSQEAVYSARIEVLEPAIRKSMLSSAISITIFGGLLFAQSPLGLGIWIVIRVVVSAICLLALGRLSRAAHDADRALQVMAAIMAVSGVAWGAIPMLVRPGEPEWRVIVVLWLFGNQSVVTAVCAASRLVFRAACGSVTLIGAIGMLLYGDAFSLVLAGLVILGGAYSLSIFGAMHQSVNHAIEGRLAAADLAASLSVQQTELQEANETLAQLASRDELTSMLNRRSFYQHVVDDKDCLSTEGWLVYLDLDKFKAINDTYGHAAGDQILQIVTRRWERAMPAGGVLARTGGDEFAGWFAAETQGEAQSVGERLNNCLDSPIALRSDNSVVVTCSIGMTKARSGEPFVDAAARADKALYRVKEHGRNSVELVSDTEAAEPSTDHGFAVRPTRTS